MAAGHVPKLNGGPFWLVDPLDGTKEFIKRNGEFTVNIALIEDGRPTLGIVLAPATDTLWRGAEGLGADKSEKGGAFTRDPHPPGPGRRPDGLRQPPPCDLQRSRHLVPQQQPHRRRSRAGGLVAEVLPDRRRQADIYPRFGPTNEWDTAAGQGVLEAAGGEVVTTDDRPLAYGKPGFGNPHFIARSKAAR